MMPIKRAEILELDSWSLVGHYKRNQLKYVKQGRIIVSNNPSGFPITEDELAEGLYEWLSNVKDWEDVLRNKPHLSRTKYDAVTILMAKYIVSVDFALITP